MSGMVVIKWGPYGPWIVECPDCEGGGEVSDPHALGSMCCERCDGSGEVDLRAESREQTQQDGENS